MIDNNTAVQFLHSFGLSVSKETLLQTELMIVKVLQFQLHPPNPLAYVEILLEVLGKNRSKESSVWFIKLFFSLLVVV